MKYILRKVFCHLWMFKGVTETASHHLAFKDKCVFCGEVRYRPVVIV